MKKLELNQFELVGGASTSFRAGAVCGMALAGALIVTGLSGGAGFIPMLGGAVLPACGIGIYAMYQ